MFAQGNAEQVLLAFSREVKAVLCAKASDDHLGQGAEYGIDYLELSCHHKVLSAKSPQDAGRLLSIGQSAVWDPVRVAPELGELAGCPLCGVRGCDWRLGAHCLVLPIHP